MLAPIISCKITTLGIYKTNMSMEKTKMSDNNTVVSFEKKLNNKSDVARFGLDASFSKGMYTWVMFVLNFYTRVKETLKIDFESFVILQVVVSHYLYNLNKNGSKNFAELEKDIASYSLKNKKRSEKLNIASISDILQLPRETVRRKAIKLEKDNILILNTIEGIKLGPAYKTVYKKFVTQTTLDVGTLVKKWKNAGVLDNLLDTK